MLAVRDGESPQAQESSTRSVRPQPNSKFEASLGYMSPFLRKNNPMGAIAHTLIPAPGSLRRVDLREILAWSK